MKHSFGMFWAQCWKTPGKLKRILWYGVGHVLFNIGELFVTSDSDAKDSPNKINLEGQMPAAKVSPECQGWQRGLLVRKWAPWVPRNLQDSPVVWVVRWSKWRWIYGKHPQKYLWFLYDMISKEQWQIYRKQCNKQWSFQIDLLKPPLPRKLTFGNWRKMRKLWTFIMICSGSYITHQEDMN